MPLQPNSLTLTRETREVIAISIANAAGDTITVTRPRSSRYAAIEVSSPYVPYRQLRTPDAMRRFCFQHGTNEKSVRAGVWNRTIALCAEGEEPEEDFGGDDYRQDYTWTEEVDA